MNLSGLSGRLLVAIPGIIIAVAVVAIGGVVFAIGVEADYPQAGPRLASEDARAIDLKGNQ